MLPRQHRLTTTTEIEKIYTQGRRLFHPLMRLVHRPASESVSRATVVVSKRVDRRAVERNRLKRSVRAALPDLLALQTTPKDMIIILQPRARGASQAQLTKAVYYLMKQLSTYDN